MVVEPLEGAADQGSDAKGLQGLERGRAGIAGQHRRLRAREAIRPRRVNTRERLVEHVRAEDRPTAVTEVGCDGFSDPVADPVVLGPMTEVDERHDGVGTRGWPDRDG